MRQQSAVDLEEIQVRPENVYLNIRMFTSAKHQSWDNRDTIAD